MPPQATTSPYLVPYQQRWLLDPSHRKCMVKSRRIGGSEVMSVEIAMAVTGIDPVTRKACRSRNQAIVSASWPQAKKLLARVVRVIRAFEKATGPLFDGTPTATQARMRNGCTLEAFSTRASSLRGDGADVTLDEFAALPHAEEMWAAAQPMTAPTLGNSDGFKLRVCFTPLGDDNMAHRVAKGDLSDSFSVHEVTIHDAIKDGFPLRGTIDDLRDEVGDPDIFAQEYECSFLASAMRYIGADLYDKCLYYSPEDVPSGDYMRFGGMDVARKRHNSAILIGERKGDTVWHTDTQTMRDAEWDAQEAWVSDIIPRCSRFCVDSTGLGSQFAERLVKEYGSVVEPVEFTQKSKEALASGLKLAFGRGRIRMKADDVETRRDVLNLRRIVTDAGNVRYDAPETKGGHADRAWALALMIEAAGGAAKSTGRAVPPGAIPSATRKALGGAERTRPRQQPARRGPFS